jgi:dihydrofolate reductase
MHAKPRIALVVAMSRTTRAIGNKGKLPWHIPEDLQRFKTLTLNHPVIMGRKTFESIVSYIGTPLPNRTNIVISRNHEYTYPGAMVVQNLEEALENARVIDLEEIHIGGGAEVYKDALPLVDRLYLTLVDDEPTADTFFPPYEDTFTTVLAREKHSTKDGLTYEWLTLERPNRHT